MSKNLHIPGHKGALFDLKGAGFEDPLLVNVTNAIGTKLKTAIEAQKYDTVGTDLVALCANNLAASGAKPLLFWHRFAAGTLDVTSAKRIVGGIEAGCKQAGCVLAGRDKSDMAAVHGKGAYDLSGFAVGAAERQSLLPQADIAMGDAVLGLAAEGLHTNGYSLVRKILTQAKLSYDKPAPFDPNRKLADLLLAPSRIYAQSVFKAVQAKTVKSATPVTEGGLLDSVARILPEGFGVSIDAKSWLPPPIFAWLARTGNLNADEMAHTFNCGIGMVLIAPEAESGKAVSILTEMGEKVFRLGVIEPCTSGDNVVLSIYGKVWPC
ncbi:MAG: phosphoribosylformylglycinamidine cyclo-ligase [Alphaproteobacteria bacterium]|nr:phosphoribosylformylglycinamidine cyclo-ligase [Alphaproteobacteria bacterium]